MDLPIKHPDDDCTSSNSPNCCWNEPRIGPSILNSDLANLSQECSKLLTSGADYLHLDVMDGSFVPNLTFGHPVVACLRKSLGPKPYFDMHMMVQHPLKWISPMSDAGANSYTFHMESSDDPGECIRHVKEAGMKVGIAIKPGTDVQVVASYVTQVDLVLVMTVEPGFGGQKFMPDMMDKVRWLRDKFSRLDIEVDGGVGPATIDTVANAGANLIVSGTAVTGAADPDRVITEMREKVRIAQERQQQQVRSQHHHHHDNKP